MLVKIVNRKFDKDCTDIKEAIRYLTQDQPANSLQGDGEEKYEENEDRVLQVESSSKSSSSSNNFNSSDDSVSSLDDSDGLRKNKDGSKEEEDQEEEDNVLEAEEHTEKEQGEWAAKTAEDASKIDDEGEVEVTSPDDEAERNNGSKEEDNKEEEKEEGKETPGGKESLGEGARKTASWMHKDGNISDEEEGEGGGNRTLLAGNERENVGNQQKESSNGMQLRKKNKGSKIYSKG